VSEADPGFVLEQDRPVGSRGPHGRRIHRAAVARNEIDGVPDHRVATRPARDDVTLAVFGIDAIVSGAAREHVTAWAADEQVGAGIAFEPVVGTVTEEPIGSLEPSDHIAAVAASQEIGAFAPDDRLGGCRSHDQHHATDKKTYDESQTHLRP
jgi:hypothetical protein